MRTDFDEYLTQLLDGALRKTGVPGISVAVSAGGVRFAAARGVADVTTGVALSVQHRFQIGCITKLLTALIVSRLVDLNLLSPDASVNACLPTQDAPQLDKAITVRHLASHTGGYEGHNLADPEVGYYYTEKKFASFLLNTPRTFTPGAVFNYDHSQFVILGEIIRHLTGRTVSQLLREWLLEPLRLAPGSLIEDQQAPRYQVAQHVPDTLTYKKVRAVPYCGFWAASLADLTLSPDDLVTLGELLVGTTTLSEWSADTLARQREPLIYLPEVMGGITCEQIPVTFGFGCARYRNGAFGHNGSARGQTIGFRFEPRAGLALAVAINSWHPQLRDVLVQTIFKAVAPLCSERAEHDAAPSTSSNVLEGQYDGGVQGIRVEVSRLENGFQCLTYNRSAPGTLRIVLRPDTRGRLLMQAQVPPPSLAFFSEPQTGRSCLMLGLNAFRAAA